MIIVRDLYVCRRKVKIKHFWFCQLIVILIYFELMPNEITKTLERRRFGGGIYSVSPPSTLNAPFAMMTDETVSDRPSSLTTVATGIF